MSEQEGLDQSPLCSFCSKLEGQVRKLIKGPADFICDGCIDLIGTSFLADEPPKTGTGGSQRCSFCSKKGRAKLFEGTEVAICNECIGLCNDILDDALR